MFWCYMYFVLHVFLHFSWNLYFNPSILTKNIKEQKYTSNVALLTTLLCTLHTCTCITLRTKIERTFSTVLIYNRANFYRQCISGCIIFVQRHVKLPVFYGPRFWGGSNWQQLVEHSHHRGIGEHPGQEILYQKSKLYQKSDNKIFLLLNKCKKHNISAEHVELTLRRWTRASVYFSYNTPHRSHPRIS